MLSGYFWVFNCQINWRRPNQHPVTSLTAFMFPVSCSWLLSSRVCSYSARVSRHFACACSCIAGRGGFSPVGVVAYNSSARFRRYEDFRFNVFLVFFLVFTFGAALSTRPQ